MDNQFLAQPPPQEEGFFSLQGATTLESMDNLITPVELAKELGHEGESRPGKKVRDFLRKRHPDHISNQRWKLTSAEADEVRAHFLSN